MQELTVKQKLTNYYYFIAINSLIAIFIGCFYFLSPWQYIKPILLLPEYMLLFIFTFTSHISIIVLFSLLVGIFGLLSIFLPKLIRVSLQSLIAIIALTFLFIDTHLFFTDGIHLIDIFKIKPLIYFKVYYTDKPIGYLKTIILIFTFIIEFLLLKWLDKTSWITEYKIGRKFILIVALCTMIASTIYLNGSCLCKKYITTNTAHLPWNTASNNISNSNDWQQLNQYKYNTDINYPLKPLQITKVKQPMNILIIGIDAWHYNYFNKESCPNLWNLAQTGTNFTQHFSGSNFTKEGLFSLFYGIPTTYWNNFLNKQQSPVLIDQLQKLNYQFGVFVSDALESNKLDKTIFSKITNLRPSSQGKTPVEKDNNTTNDWLSWFNNIDETKPFFSFLFYFSAHEHDFPVDLNSKNIPTNGKLRYSDIIEQQGVQNFKQGYQNSIQYIDSLTKKIIIALKQQDMLNNTLIIITADHGTEINDNGQNMYGHGNNLSDCQLHVPFAIVGADFNKKNISTLTSHYDVAPTLIKNFLGVTNNIADYSTGFDLLDNSIRPNWHIATNCRLKRTINSIGIITKNYCNQYFPSGKFTSVNKKNIPIIIQSYINNNYLSQAVEMMTRFIKK